MNGPSSKTQAKLESFVTPKQQQMIRQKKETRKFILCLILTNILTVFIIKTAHQNDTSSSSKTSLEKIKGFTRLQLSLKLFVPLGRERQAVGLYNKNGQLVVKKAHLELPKSSKKSPSNWSNLEKLSEYSIWVPHKKVPELTQYSQDELMAYPFNNQVTTGVPKTAAQRKSYEIIF